MQHKNLIESTFDEQIVWLREKMKIAGFSYSKEEMETLYTSFCETHPEIKEEKLALDSSYVQWGKDGEKYRTFVSIFLEVHPTLKASFSLPDELLIFDKEAVFYYIDLLAEQPRITEVNFPYSLLDDDVAIALAKIPHLTNFNLEGNIIGENGLAALRARTDLKNPNVEYNDPDPLALSKDILKKTYASFLTKYKTMFDIEIYDNGRKFFFSEYVDADAFPLVFPAFKAYDTQEVILNNKKCPPQVLEKLTSISSITSLTIHGGNQIGDAGVKTLAQLHSLINVRLYFQAIGEDGALDLATLPHISCLHLIGNYITSSGAAALARNTSLTELSLRYNNSHSSFPDEIAQVFVNNMTLKHLDIRDMNGKGSFSLKGETVLSYGLNFQGTFLLSLHDALDEKAIPALAFHPGFLLTKNELEKCSETQKAVLQEPDVNKRIQRAVKAGVTKINIPPLRQFCLFRVRGLWASLREEQKNSLADNLLRKEASAFCVEEEKDPFVRIG